MLYQAGIFLLILLKTKISSISRESRQEEQEEGFFWNKFEYFLAKIEYVID